MQKYITLLLAILPSISNAGLIEIDESDRWQSQGSTHYIRSKEDQNFVAQIVSVGRLSSVVSFYDTGSNTCFGDGGDTKKIKVFYQWVNYVEKCWGGNGYWVPRSQRGIEFVNQKFSSNSDVKIDFGSNSYTFSTKKFISAKQRWERTLKVSGDAL